MMKRPSKARKQQHPGEPFLIPNPYFMILKARALHHASKKAHKNTEPPISDPDSFSADLHTASILLPLATEIALKAYHVRESDEQPPDGHDLLCLYDQLSDATQQSLELKMPLIPDFLQIPTLIPLSRPFLSLRDILKIHRNDFIKFRYSYEYSHLTMGFSELDQALTVILDAYPPSTHS